MEIWSIWKPGIRNSRVVKTGQSGKLRKGRTVLEQETSLTTENRKKKNRKKRKKNRKQQKQQLALCIAVIGLSLAAAAGGIWWAFSSGGDSSQVAQLETAVQETEAEETLTQIPETEEETETETETVEPEIYVELTDENREGFVKVESCEIAAGTGNFVLKATVEEKPVSDDDNFYLFEMKMYDTQLNQDGNYIDSAVKGKEFSLQAAVNENKSDSRLYSKFVVAVKLNGEYVALCEPQYITNPEALAAYQAAFPESSSIKGILVDPLKLKGNELDDLGVKHAAYNIPISNILGETTNGLYPTIYYTYNGQDKQVTATFNEDIIRNHSYIFNINKVNEVTEEIYYVVDEWDQETINIPSFK